MTHGFLIKNVLSPLPSLPSLLLALFLFHLFYILWTLSVVQGEVKAPL